MFWIITVSLLIFLIIWLLTSPIYIYLIWNDSQQELQLRWAGVFQASVLPIEQVWSLQIQTLFFKKEWPLLKLIATRKKTSAAKPRKARNWRPKHFWKRVQLVYKSFRLEALHVNLDTGDHVINAYLHAMTSLTKGVDWNINFEGKTELDLMIRNRLFRLLYAAFRK